MVQHAEYELMFNTLLYFIWFALSEQLLQLFLWDHQKGKHATVYKSHCDNVQ